MLVTSYKDTVMHMVGFFTDTDCDKDNTITVDIPEEILWKWFHEASGLENEWLDFDVWYSDIYDCDDIESFWYWEGNTFVPTIEQCYNYTCSNNTYFKIKAVMDNVEW